MKTILCLRGMLFLHKYMNQIYRIFQQMKITYDFNSYFNDDMNM